MAKYRKKPVVIEAEVYKEGLEDGWQVLWTTDDGDYSMFFEEREEAESFVEHLKNNHDKQVEGDLVIEDIMPSIKTLEGYHSIRLGDYIVTGVKGERYPCKPDIFHMTYESLLTDEQKKEFNRLIEAIDKGICFKDTDPEAEYIKSELGEETKVTKTNYEKIKSMTVEEMAEWLDSILNQDREDWNEPGCYHCAYHGTHHQPKDCGVCEYKNGLKSWLEQEVKVG